MVRNIYNSTNNLLTNLTGASKIDYLVSIYLLRPASAQVPLIYTNINYDGTFVQAGTTTSHSPLVSGTFTLKVGGVPIDPYTNGTLPYNVNPSVI